MKYDYAVLAIRNLRRRGVRSWLTLLGIIIGITAVVALISLGDGLKLAVNSQFDIGSTEIISVQAGGISGYGPPGSGVTKPLTKQDAEAIERISSIEFAIPRNIETLKVEYNQKLNIGFAGSIPEGKNKEVVYEVLGVEAEQGRLLYDGDNDKIVIGNDFTFASKSGFDKAVSLGDVMIIQNKSFRIVGIMKKKGSFIMDKVILMKDTPLRDLMNTGDNVDIIAVKVKDKDLMNEAKIDIEKLLRDRRDVKLGQEDFEVSTPEASLATINSILNGVQAFIVLIALISIFVGAIGIVNTMTTSVMERVKEIGIMKAIGAKNSDIFYQFFIEAGLLGLVGGVIGISLGMIIGFLGVTGINSFIGSSNSFSPNLLLILGTLLGSFLVGSISGIAPALKAAKLNPVDALRK